MRKNHAHADLNAINYVCKRKEIRSEKPLCQGMGFRGGDPSRRSPTAMNVRLLS